MSYTPNQKQLEVLINGLIQVPFFEWAVRPFGFHFWEVNQVSYYNDYPKFIGKRFKYVVILSNGDHEIMYRNKKQQQEFIESFQKKTKDIDFLRIVERKINKAYLEVWDFAAKMEKTKYKKFSNQQLIRQYEKYHSLYSHFIGGVSTGILIAEAMAIDIKKYLEGQAKQLGIDGEVDLTLRTLSTPLKLSMTAQEEYELLRIVTKLPKDKFLASLKKHEAKWSYVPMYSQFAAWTLEDFKQRAKNLVVGAKNRYVELYEHAKRTKQAKKEIFLKFNCSQEIKELSDLLSKYIYWRINDETTIGLLTRNRQGLFREIATRIHVSQAQLNHMTLEEIVAALSGKEPNITLINERQKRYAVILNPQGVAVLSGSDLEKFLKKVKFEKVSKSSKKEKQLQGTPANPGRATGTVKVVLNPKFINKVNKGDILVTPNTTPAYVLAMKISGAIVTEEGGITSHAAIVSRELGIPCVIGVPDVTKVLKDGDKVEVDAEKGIVRKI